MCGVSSVSLSLFRRFRNTQDSKHMFICWIQKFERSKRRFDALLVWDSKMQTRVMYVFFFVLDRDIYIYLYGGDAIFFLIIIDLLLFKSACKQIMCGVFVFGTQKPSQRGHVSLFFLNQNIDLSPVATSSSFSQSLTCLYSKAHV